MFNFWIDILISGMALAQSKQTCLGAISTAILISWHAVILLLRTWAIWGLSRYILAYLLLVDTVSRPFYRSA